MGPEYLCIIKKEYKAENIIFGSHFRVQKGYTFLLHVLHNQDSDRFGMRSRRGLPRLCLCGNTFILCSNNFVITVTKSSLLLFLSVQSISFFIFRQKIFRREQEYQHLVF